MNPVFNTNITDEFGDMWPNAVTRVDDIQVHKSSISGLRVQDNDTYEEVEVKLDDEGKPFKVVYSVEFWSKIQLKQQGKRSRQYSKGGECTFEIDMSNPEVERKWSELPDDYNRSLVLLAQWHFRSKVIVG